MIFEDEFFTSKMERLRVVQKWDFGFSHVFPSFSVWDTWTKKISFQGRISPSFFDISFLYVWRWLIKNFKSFEDEFIPLKIFDPWSFLKLWSSLGHYSTWVLDIINSILFTSPTRTQSNFLLILSSFQCTSRLFLKSFLPPSPKSFLPHSEKFFTPSTTIFIRSINTP